MERRLSWCTIAILFVLLFVTSEALRGHNSQVDEKQRSQTSVNRGTARFDIKKSLDNYETTIGPSLARSRVDRDRNTEIRRSPIKNKDDRVTYSRNVNVVKESFGSRDRERSTINDRTINPDKTTNLSESKQQTRRNDRRYLPERDDKKNGRKIDHQEISITTTEPSITTIRSRSRKENVNTPRRVSSRVGSVRKVKSRYLEVNTGPSVFSGTTENSRSRTGRKINTTYNDKNSSKRISSGNNRRYNSEITANNTRRNNGTTRGSKKDTDLSRRRTTDKSTQLTESESIRVDIPLTLVTTDYPKLTTININDNDNDQSFRSSSSSRKIERRNDDRDYVRSNLNESKNLDRTKARRKSKTNVVDHSTTQRSITINQKRGSSRFADFVLNDTIDFTTIRTYNKDDNGNDVRRRSTDRTRNTDRKFITKDDNNNESINSRTRGRSLDIVSRSVSNGSSSSFQTDIKRRSSPDRNNNRKTEIRSRSLDNVQDQDNRGRSRGRIRIESTTTKLFIDPSIETTTSTSDQSTNVPISDTSITTMRTSVVGQRESARTITDDLSSSSSSRVRSRNRNGSQSRNTTREDYFNYGLGFRGRKFPTNEETTTKNTSIKSSRLSQSTSQQTGARGVGNPGWTLLRRKPEFQSSISTTEKESVINEIATNNESSSTTTTTTTTAAAAATTAATTATTAAAATTTTMTTTTIVSTTRNRGSKKSKIEDTTATFTTMSPGTTKNFNSTRRGNKNQSDKNINIDKLSDSEESDNYPPDFKARLSQLKNSNLKIPVAKSTPRTSTEGKKTSGVSFSERSRMKLELARRLVKPELNEQENVLDSTGKLRTTDTSIGEETKRIGKLAKVIVRNSRLEEDDKKPEKIVKQDQTIDSGDQESWKSRQKKGRVVSERTVTSISVDEDTSNYVVETVTKVTEEVSSMMIDGSILKDSQPRKTKSQDLTNIETTKSTKGFNVTPRSTIKGLKSGSLLTRRNKSFVERDITNNGDDVDTRKDELKRINTSTTILSKRKQSSSENDEQQQDDGRTKKPRMLNSVTKANFRNDRYTKKLRDRSNVIDGNEIPQRTTSRTTTVTNRYSRKKINGTRPYDKISKSVTTVTSIQSSSKRREFRPRTATYRRHSELPTTNTLLIETTERVDDTQGVAITPKTLKYHATLKSSTPIETRSIPQEPQVSVRITNDTNSIDTGITDSSNGNTGTTSNIFNPTRSAFLSGNSTLLEQLRSTVAPLLSSLGNRTPIFAESYSNVNNGSSTPRITPNGSPPRFSARYKGAELFVRKPTGYQPTVPSITSSSTTQITPIEVYTTKIMEDLESVAPPSWSTDLGITNSPNGIINSESIYTNNLR